MIIKELKIKNFRSYYGDNNRFEFSDRLTVIIGDNGDGKSTFFDAIQWLLNTTTSENFLLDQHISEMRKSKMEPGESDEVSVYMRFEHDGEKSVEKSFRFEKMDNGSFRTVHLSYKGYETIGSERVAVNGKHLIDRCYDAFIQKFSMFKGEAELNVFENSALLKDLVDKFSDIRKFDNLVEYTAAFEDKSETAYRKELRSDKKLTGKVDLLERDIAAVSNEISALKSEIKKKRESITVYSQQLSQLEENQESSQRYKDIKDRLTTQEQRKNRLLASINSVNYNHALLDKMWILAPYLPILKEFQTKISAMSKAKRKMEHDFIRTQSAEQGKLEVIEEMRGQLVNGATALPWYLPTQEDMEDMIHDHICKVCGREAPEGSDAYEFMVNKLEEYKRHAEAKLKKLTHNVEEKKELFTYSHIESLHNLSAALSGHRERQVASYSQEILDRQGLVAQFYHDLKKAENKITELNDERTRLLIQIGGNISGATLEKEFNDIKGLYASRESATTRLAALEINLSQKESKLNDLKEFLNKLNAEGSHVKVAKEVYITLSMIAKAFAQAKKENLTRFLSELEDKANEYLARLSAADFYGQVRLIQTPDESTEIRLFSSNGTEIKKPSGSQKTVMYISVLFAISDFTQERREEDYPLIFDAATSSFGDSKEEDFYNVIDKLKKQCIIVTKDFIQKGQVNYGAIEGLSCNIYRIQKASNFDPLNMATVRTTIHKIR